MRIGLFIGTANVFGRVGSGYVTPIGVTFQNDTPSTEGGYTLPTGTTAVTGTNSGHFTVSGGKLFKASGGALSSPPYTLTCNNTGGTTLYVTSGGAGWDIGTQGEWDNVGAAWFDINASGGHASTTNKCLNQLIATYQPQNNSTVTFATRVFTFKTAVASERDVKIGATIGESMLNLARCINMSGGINSVGGDYLVSIPDPKYTATVWAHTSWTQTSSIVVTSITSGTANHADTWQIGSWNAGQASGGARALAGAGTVASQITILENKALVVRSTAEIAMHLNGATGTPFRRFTNTRTNPITVRSDNYLSGLLSWDVATSQLPRVVDRVCQSGGAFSFWGFYLPWTGRLWSDRVISLNATAWRGDKWDFGYNLVEGWRPITNKREAFYDGAYSVTYNVTNNTWQGGEGIKFNSIYDAGLAVHHCKFRYCTRATGLTTADAAEVSDCDVQYYWDIPYRWFAGAAGSTSGITAKATTRRCTAIYPMSSLGSTMATMVLTSGSTTVTGPNSILAVEGSIVRVLSGTGSLAAGTRVVSIASDGSSLTLSAAATGNGTATLEQKGDSIELNGAGTNPHPDAMIWTGGDTMPTDWTTETDKILVIGGGSRGVVGPIAHRDNEGLTGPYTIPSLSRFATIQNPGGGGSAVDWSNLKTLNAQYNGMYGAPGLTGGSHYFAAYNGLRAPSGTHMISRNVTRTFAYTIGGNAGGNIPLTTDNDVTWAAAFNGVTAGGGYKGNKWLPETYADAISTYSPKLNGTLHIGSGIYAGPMFPNGAWNDGTAYNPSDSVWLAEHPPITVDLASAPTSTLNISFGQKTLGGHGGVDTGYTGMVTISGTGASHWTIDAYKRIVPAGAYHAAAPAFSGPYSLTVSGNGVSRTVNITMIPNAYSVRWREDNEADYFTGAGPGNELSRIMVDAGRAFGDRVICRSGIYNPTQNISWRLGKDNASVPTGTWNGSNWVRIESEFDYGAIFTVIAIAGPTVSEKYIEFYRLTFSRTNLAGSDPPSTPSVFTTDSPKYVKFNQNRFVGIPSLIGNPSVTDTLLASGIQATATNTISDWYVVDNQFDSIFRGVQLAGFNHKIIGNTFTRIYDDDGYFINAYNCEYSWNTSINKYAALTDTHGDFLTFAFTSLAPGVYTGFQMIGNIMVRGDGTPGAYDGQGLYMGNASEIPAGVTFTGTKIQGNFYFGSMGRGISTQGLTNPEISFNTLLTDVGSNYSSPLNPGITMGENGSGGQVRYNVCTGGIGYEDGASGATIAFNVSSTANTLVNYQSLFVNPQLGANNVSIAQVLTDFAMKSGGGLANTTTGFAHNVGAIGTGYVDYIARTTSFPEDNNSAGQPIGLLLALTKAS